MDKALRHLEVQEGRLAAIEDIISQLPDASAFVELKAGEDDILSQLCQGLLDIKEQLPWDDDNEHGSWFGGRPRQ
jgi:hypothetical protein